MTIKADPFRFAVNGYPIGLSDQIDTLTIRIVPAFTIAPNDPYA